LTQAPRHSASGRRFAVATPHQAATEAALDTFAEGGNAVDAALAANAVLAVVYPHMCGIGGDLFAIVASAGGGTPTLVNGSGAAAAALSAAAVRADHDSMPADGPLTVSVPGALAAWADLAQRFGRRPLAPALERAAALAERGWPVAPSTARAIATHCRRVEGDPGLRALLMPGGRALEAGERIALPALAATLRDVAVEGPGAFYEGAVGDRFVGGLSRLGCPLTRDDLRSHATEIARPLAARYRDLEVLVPAPNSQGFVLLEILRSIERAALVSDHLGPDAAVLAGLFQLGSADRDRFLADPRQAAPPLDALLGGEHLDELVERARPGGRGDVEPPMIDARRAGGDTVGVVAAESEGLWVSINQSLYSSFGAAILEPATGIICQNRGSHFSLDPESPNRLVGGVRPAHTLMPVMVAREGRPVMASATMGGNAHPQIHTEVLTAVIDRHRSAWQALELPRWLVGGVQRGGGTVIQAEARVPQDTLARLAEAGMEVALLDPFDERVGHAQLIVRSGPGELSVASDPRADGQAAAG
jgi:gamma-glutamyltranspeptidase